MKSAENKGPEQKYIFIHLGARAHYQLPEAVSDNIYRLYTDIWIPSNSLTLLLSKLPFAAIKKLLQRHHEKIKNDKVISFPLSLFFQELYWKIKGVNGWEKIIRRNSWFQHKVKNHLDKYTPSGSKIMFTFAYTALEPLKFAKSKGWKTILYQMDPGLEEEEIVKKELAASAFIDSSWKPAPKSYWDQWKEELTLSDKIIVNSIWSKSALQKIQTPDDKIKVIPLALETNPKSLNFNRTYPEKFSIDRPMKILFLGILTLRKGLRPLLEAIELLKDKPLEFIFVGTPETKIQENPKIKVVASVSRAETSEYYKKADVFLFPTLSDGFGLTQLEAFQWKLPIISSQYCGDVVENNKNGIVLKEVTADQISQALLKCLINPSILSNFSEKTSVRVNQFSINRLGKELEKIYE